MSALAEGRERLDRLMEEAQRPFLTRLALGAAVLQARANEQQGDETDTCRFANVLAKVTADAARRGDNEAVHLRGAQLLAVLSDVADLGDEQAAEAINTAAADMPAEMLHLATTCSHLRRLGLQ